MPRGARIILYSSPERTRRGSVELEKYYTKQMFCTMTTAYIHKLNWMISITTFLSLLNAALCWPFPSTYALPTLLANGNKRYLASAALASSSAIVAMVRRFTTYASEIDLPRK